MIKKICIVTGSRSEYGLLYWLIKAINKDPAFKLQLIASASHLSHEFGLTYKKILDDGFAIDQKVELLLSSDTAVGITKSIGLGVIGFADAYANLCPDLIVLLGDRFETLAAAQAAFIAKIPIAHIHGGELSEGAYDDGIRHSITKMSHLHFVATPSYRQRVIQLGEDPKRVFHVGAMVLDSISHHALLTKNTLEDLLQLKFNNLSFAITYHPETLGNRQPKQDFSELLSALENFKDATLIFTKGNSDSEGRVINDMIDEFCRNHNNAKAFVELGHLNYLSLLNIVDITIGNSSSGIIEAPYFKIPTVNIGDRQRGRIKPSSVIDCEPTEHSIVSGINRGLSPQFQKEIQSMILPYGDGNIAEKIVQVFKETDLTEVIKKRFYDIDVE